MATDAAPPYSLLTKVFDPRHTVVLRDWLEFLTIPPHEVVAYIPDRDDVRQAVDALCRQHSIPWREVQKQPGEDLRKRDFPILERMVDAMSTDMILFINLDTLPYREGAAEERWLQEVFERLSQDDSLVFFSGCGLVFRADTPDTSGRFLRTVRFSGNFALIDKSFWRSVFAAHPYESTPQADLGRFYSEWAIEEECRQRGLYGLRRIDSRDWRVFHVQQWDEGLLKTRDLFRRGVGVDRFFNRVHEDYKHPWQWYYNYPSPPLVKRLRIWLGEQRRDLWARIWDRSSSRAQ